MMKALRDARAWYILAALTVVGLTFQFFLRYQYIHLTGGMVMRVDRLNGSSCNMPCDRVVLDPARVRSNTFDSSTFDDDNLKAIEAVKRFVVTPPYANDDHDYKWRVTQYGNNQGRHDDASTAFILDGDWPVRLVCYCYFDTPGQKSPTGYWWEYHLDTRQTYSVLDNAMLSAKYGLRRY